MGQPKPLLSVPEGQGPGKKPRAPLSASSPARWQLLDTNLTADLPPRPAPCDMWAQSLGHPCCLHPWSLHPQQNVSSESGQGPSLLPPHLPVSPGPPACSPCSSQTCAGSQHATQRPPPSPPVNSSPPSTSPLPSHLLPTTWLPAPPSPGGRPSVYSAGVCSCPPHPLCLLCFVPGTRLCPDTQLPH